MNYFPTDRYEALSTKEKCTYFKDKLENNMEFEKEKINTSILLGNTRVKSRNEDVRKKTNKNPTGDFGRQNIKCDECGKMYRDKFNLSKHTKSAHTKTVTCKRCDKQFAGSYSLRSHLKNCNYTCDKCDFMTTRIHDIEAHIRHHARKTSNPLTERITIVYK